jgi:hypothetical protein
MEAAGRQAFADAATRALLCVRRHGDAALLDVDAAAGMGISPYLLYYRVSFAPAYSRNPDEKKCRIRLA